MKQQDINCYKTDVTQKEWIAGKKQRKSRRDQDETATMYNGRILFLEESTGSSLQTTIPVVGMEASKHGRRMRIDNIIKHGIRTVVQSSFVTEALLWHNYSCSLVFSVRRCPKSVADSRLAINIVSFVPLMKFWHNCNNELSPDWWVTVL